MPWTQASDPSSGTWSGNCNQLDIFTPTSPTDLTSGSSAGALLEGFEFPISVYNGTNELIWDYQGTGGVVPTLTTDVRSATATAGHALTIASTSAGGCQFASHYQPGVNRLQYYRIYFKITAYTNGNGFTRSTAFAAWSGATGLRSNASIVFPATPGTGPFIAVEHNVPGMGTSDTGTVTLSLNTWYRLEMITELLTNGQWTTGNLYLGDTTTLVDFVQCHSAGTAGGGFILFGASETNGGNNITMVFDDIYVRGYTHPDITVTTPLNTQLNGPGGVWAMYPRAAGALTQWTPASGTNFSNVDEFPLAIFDDDTSYVSATGASTLTDLFAPSYHPTTTFPTENKVIKIVTVQHNYRYVSGAGIAYTQSAYKDPLDMLFTGPVSTTTFPHTTYQLSSYLGVSYEDNPLPVNFSPYQQLGYVWNPNAPAATDRVTSVWGLLEIGAA